MEEIKVNSYSEIKKICDSAKGTVFFRGQSNKEWDLIPSIARNVENYSFNNEIENYKKNKVSSEKNTISTLFKMQHYGEKTRLLDITSNYEIALYFACSDNFDKDGSLFIIKKLNILTDENISIIQKVFNNLELNSKEKNEINENFVLDEEYLMYNNSRSMIQGGSSIFCGWKFINDSIECINDKGFGNLIAKKIVIPTSLKQEILNLLKNKGIDENTIYNSNYKMQNVKIVDCNNIKYNERKNKYLADIIVNTRFFSKEGIYSLINNKINEIKIKYGLKIKIWFWVYFDLVDKTSCNYICTVVWSNGNQIIKYNQKYHQKFLLYDNQAINDHLINQRWVELCERAIDWYEKLQKKSITEILESTKKSRKIITDIMREMENMSHGSAINNSKEDKFSSLIYAIFKLLDWINCDPKKNDYLIKNDIKKIEEHICNFMK